MSPRPRHLAPHHEQVILRSSSLANRHDCRSHNSVDLSIFFRQSPGDFHHGLLGIAFGDALSCATTAATDDGHFIARAGDHLLSDRPCFCDACP
jgi:hypothetical protein